MNTISKLGRVKKLTKKNSTKSTVTYTVKGLKKGKEYQVHYIAYKKTSARKASAIIRTTDKTSPKAKQRANSS